MLSEQNNVIERELEPYIQQMVKFILGVNTRSFTKRVSELILKKTRGEIFHILHIPDIPKILTENLEKIA
ncbi:MAG: hypothetical protein ACTSWY_07200 [Promethearchaeota archaeon]